MKNGIFVVRQVLGDDAVEMEKVYARANLSKKVLSVVAGGIVLALFAAMMALAGVGAIDEYFDYIDSQPRMFEVESHHINK